MKTIFTGFVVVLIGVGAAMAQSASQKEKLRFLAQATPLVSAFAEQNCGALRLSGSSEKLNLDGKTSASVSALSKFLGNLGIEGAGKLETKEFSNVLQEELPAVLKDTQACRMHMTQVVLAFLFEEESGSQAMQTQPSSQSQGIAPVPLTMVNGTTKLISPNQNVFTMVKTPYSARSDLVRVSLDGVEYSLAVGNKLAVTGSAAACDLFVTRIDYKRGEADFLVRCQ